VALTAPVPRSPHRVLRDVTTAERRSHAVLGLARSCTVHSGTRRDTTHPFERRVTGVERPTPCRPRPPFTRTATLFGALRTALFEARMLPADFCNCLRRTDEWIRDSPILAGTMAMTTFLFLRITRDPLELRSSAVGANANTKHETRGAVIRGEPRSRPCDRDPGAGSSW